MMMCTRCKKRPATVFITTMQGENKKNEGLCLVCAKELNVPQISEYMQKLGISDDELEQFADQMASAFDTSDMPGTEGDSFEVGGAGTFSPFIQSIFGNPQANGENGEKRDKRAEKQEKAEKKKLKFLSSYCTNLSEKAENGKLDAIIGRDKEISRVIQILSRRTKNNPCLIGEPGVGKTAIAEGIALKIASGNVPFNLRGKKVWLLDLTALVAGTQFRGQFESRVKGLIDEVKREGNIILFIDEVHSLVGTGDSEGSMNAANILKPALSRGEVQVIGATTFDEYRKYIEKDGALERRFQPVPVNEPTIDETIDVLLGIRKYYEDFHRVKISGDMVRMCVILSERYIHDRFLPDKAIDLLDESCACAEIRSKELDEYSEAKQNLDTFNNALKELEEQESPDYEQIAKIKAEILKAQETIDKLQKTVENIYVTENDIAKVIELWTGIPAKKIEETEFTKIANIGEKIKEKIIGQDEAVELVAKAVKRTRVRLSKRKRPASFIFVGPTGVGKTELVKVLSQELFDTADPLIRLDMSEFMEKHAVSRIIGSPPGYVGYDEAGQLTEKVRRKPYSVILFDEIEKAHPDVMNILLQILDEGKINDAQGRTVSFENTVIVMTSNAGSTDKSTGMGFAKTAGDVSKERAMKGLAEFLRPEFLGRVDEIVVFRPLDIKDYVRIAKLMLEEMREPLEEKKIALEYDESVLELIAKKAFGSTKSGARDIRRVLRKEIEDKVASAIIDTSAISKISIAVNGEEFEVTTQ